MTDEQIAEAHAKWTSQFFYWTYKQAMLHGIKHGRELQKKEAKKE